MSEQPPSTTPRPFAGVLRSIRRHPTTWIAAGLTAGFLILATGAVLAGVATGSRAFAAAATDTPTPTPTIDPPRPVPTDTTATTRLRTCSVAMAATDSRLASFSGSIMRADTGEVLFDRNAAKPLETGSVMKAITAAAAVTQLGPDFQITTSVVAGATPGSIVLIGRGDPTLSATPVGAESIYRGAPKLSSLAANAIAQYRTISPGVPITSVVIDTSYWAASDAWDPSWDHVEQTGGYSSYVTPLQVDGDRADPTKQTSPRGTDPIGSAAAKFLAALHAADPGGVVSPTAATTAGVAIPSATTLAEVRSQPIRVLIQQMLLNSDNTMAEQLDRIISKQSGSDGSAASLPSVIPQALFANVAFKNLGVDTAALAANMVVRDGSGLSPLNEVAASTMATIMRAIDTGAGSLDLVRDTLPVAGKTGTLASRFTSGAAAAVRGHLMGKTGWLANEHSLGGILTAADGTKLTFMFSAIGNVGGDNRARDAIDALTAAVYACGDNLSNN